jgi:hypothetical protein
MICNIRLRGFESQNKASLLWCVYKKRQVSTGACLFLDVCSAEGSGFWVRYVYVCKNSILFPTGVESDFLLVSMTAGVEDAVKICTGFAKKIKE